MSETKHTLGPWRAVAGTGAWNVTTVGGPRTFNICRVNTDRTEQEDIARLLAAAPDLLKSALIEEAFDTHGYTHAALDWLIAHGVEVDKAAFWQPIHYSELRNATRRAAIEKAAQA